MLKATPAMIGRKQGLAFLVTTKMTVSLVIQKSDSAQAVTLTTPVLVETALTVNSQQRVQTLKQLDTFLCNELKTN